MFNIFTLAKLGNTSTVGLVVAIAIVCIAIYRKLKY